MSAFKKIALLLIGQFISASASFANAYIQSDTTKKDSTKKGDTIKLATKITSRPDAVSTIINYPAQGITTSSKANDRPAIEQTLTTPATIVAGRTTASLDVSPSGAAIYTIPIAIPPGINGVVPQITLTYNSQAGNSLAGYGWNISGTSAINRIAPTRYHNNKIGSVNLNANDYYALDGQRLLLKSGTYGADNAEYQTETYSNLRIVSKGTTSTGPSYFVVYYPDGSTAFYGSSADSKTPTDYGISSSENAQGIHITYNYINDFNNLTISDISYGAKGSATSINHIQFSYTTRQRGEQAYVAGTSFFRSKLLTDINVTASGSAYRNYVLTYSAISDLNYERVSSIQELNGDKSKGLTPINFTYDSGDELVDHQVISDIHTDSVATTSGSAVTADFTGNGQMDFILYPTAKDKAWIFLDPKTATPFNRAGIEIGTGKFDDIFAVTELSSNNKIVPGQDILLVKHNSASVKNFEVYSTTSQQAFQTLYTRQWTAPTASSYYVESTQSQRPGASLPWIYVTGDFNGDGLTDIVAVNHPYLDTTYIKKLGEPHGTLEGSPVYTANVHFINLDRRITSNFANQAGTFTQAFGLSDKLLTGDFNGDGKTDLLHVSAGVMYVYDIGANNNLELLWTTTDSRVTTNYQILLGDYNGDGKTDVMFPTSTTAPTNTLYSFFISKGTGFNKYDQTLLFGYQLDDFNNTTSVLTSQYLIANDMDGDGKTDILESMTKTNNPGTIGEAILNVYSCKGMTSALSGPTFALESGIDQTGLPFLNHPIPLFLSKDEPNFGLEYGFLSGKSITLFNFHKDLRKETPIKTITQNGIVYSVDYSFLNSDASYNEQVFPNVNILQFPGFRLASKITRTNQEDNKVVFENFTYDGAVTNTEGLGFLGFSKSSRSNWMVSTTDLNQLWTTTFTDPALHGAPLRIFTSKHPLSPVTKGPGQPGIKPDTILSAPVTSAQTIVASNSITLGNGFTANGTNGAFDAKISDPANGINDGATTSDYLSRIDYTYDTRVLSNKTFINVPKSVTVKNLLQPTNTLTTYAYDSFYNVVTEFSNFSGIGTKTTSTTYDNNIAGGYVGRPLDKKVSTTNGADSFSTEEQYTYTGFLPTQIKRKGNGTPFITDDIVYDTYGNVTSKTTTTAAGSRTTSMQYDLSGRFVTKMTDVEGLETNMQYHVSTGNMLSKTDPYNRTTTYSYDDWNRLLQSTDFLNVNTTLDYTRSNYDIVIRNIEDGGHAKITTINNLGKTKVETTKDVLGQLVSKSYQYDAYDRTIAESEPYTSSPSQWNQIEYDEYGRIKRNTAYTGKITNVSYSGLSTTVNDGTKSVTTTNDALGNVISTTDPGGTINNTYFANGNLKSADFDGSTQTIEQDGWGRKTKLTDPSAGVYTYAYNEFGDVTTETTPKGSTTYVYDTNGKLQSKHITGDNGTDMSYTYTYDPTTKLPTLTSLTNADGNNTNYTYGYDTYKRPNSTVEDNTYAKFTKTLTYDTYGRIATETSEAKNKSNNLTASKAITNTYQNGELKAISDANGQLWAVNSLDARGNITSALLGAAIKQTNTFDTYGLPQQLKTERVSGTPVQLMALGYSFDAQRGNLTSRTSTFNTGVPYTSTEAFTYDTQDRLTGYPDISGSQTQSYDNRGRITNNPRLGDYTYTGSSYQQKGLVNMTAYADYHYQQLPLQQVSYNAFKQPVQITEQGKEKVSFQYNGGLQRSHMFYGDTTSEKLSRPMRRHYSEDGSVEITEDIPNSKTSFVFYLGGDAYSAPAIWKDERTASGTTTALYYLHRDYQGSILMITDAAGTIKEQRQLDAWGNILKLTDGAGNTLIAFAILDRGYTGHEHLLGVGLINMNGRLYDPLLHRFLSPDNYIQDASNTQNFNRYGYVLNNPLKYIDKSGEIFGLATLFGFIGGLGDAVTHGALAFWDPGKFNDGWSHADPTKPGTQGNNGWKIDKGLFQGNFGQIISRFTRELPQTLNGYFWAIGSNKLDHINSVSYYAGATLFEKKEYSGDAFTLSSFIFAGRGTKADPNDETFQHEYGHYLQSQAAGWTYMSKYAWPSEHGDAENQHDSPVERDANARALTYWKQHVPNIDWHYANNPVPDINYRYNPNVLDIIVSPLNIFPVTSWILGLVYYWKFTNYLPKE